MVSGTQNTPLSIGSGGYSYAVYAVGLRFSGLADLVDVTGEVEHLVGEAPLVRRKQSFLRKETRMKSIKIVVFICFE